MQAANKPVEQHTSSAISPRSPGSDASSEFVVFPDATHKFFLFADLSVRARRRFDEMQDEAKDILTVQTQMETRDKNDATRASAPLKPADDAVKIDSSGLTVEQVVQKMVDCIEKSP